jgi:hypothetical protein
MRGKTILSVVALVWLAGCVPPQTAAPTPPAPPEEEADAGPPPREMMEGKPLPRVDVRLLKCSTLNSATDDDKAYASTFMLGYRAALMGSHIIDTKRIDAVEQTALADCAGHPEENAIRVFAVALIKVERTERQEKAAERARAAAEKASAGPPMQFRRRPVTPNTAPLPADQDQAPAPGAAAPGLPAAEPPADQPQKE